MRSRGRYLGSDFEIWMAQRTWYWSVTRIDRNGGMIGAAATEVEAMREACLSIERSSTQPLDASGVCDDCADSLIDSSLATSWVSSLRSLERYLDSARRMTA